MNERITIRQVALALNIDPNAFILIEELEAVLLTQDDIYEFMTKAIGLDCKQNIDRKEISYILSDMRRDKMREYKLSLSEFVGWFKVDPVGALTHLLVEKIGEIHMRRIEEYQVTPEQIYERHANNKEMYLFGLLHLM
ncbi:hypothetical protein [Paenibacillus sp. FSL H3-0333]|uniref:hypothetical protein n=1 Tax=Paenibacillus sp. FSL H3-0333 TaxID=2921373 RepID=UPI0030F88097